MGLGERRGGRGGRRGRMGGNRMGHGNRNRRWGRSSAGRAARFGTLRGSVSMLMIGAFSGIFALAYSFAVGAFWALGLFGISFFFFGMAGMSFMVYKQTNGQEVQATSCVSVISVAPHASHVEGYNQGHPYPPHPPPGGQTSYNQHPNSTNPPYPPPGGPTSYNQHPNSTNPPYPPPPGGPTSTSYNQRPSSTNPAYPQMYAPPHGGQNVNPYPADGNMTAPWPTPTTSNAYDPNQPNFPPDFNRPSPSAPEAPPPTYDSVVEGDLGGKGGYP